MISRDIPNRRAITAYVNISAAHSHRADGIAGSIWQRELRIPVSRSAWSHRHKTRRSVLRGRHPPPAHIQTPAEARLEVERPIRVEQALKGLRWAAGTDCHRTAGAIKAHRA